MKRMIGAVLLIACFGFSTMGQALPRQNFWHWKHSNVNSVEIIDHDMWQDFLSRYVVEDPLTHDTDVRYGSVRPIDYKRLKYYVEFLQKQRIYDLNPDEQKAFWINLYNATVVKTILDCMPVRSVRDINLSPSHFKRGPWDAKILNVEREYLSLDDISYILRTVYHDNRVLYALSNGASGSPRLSPNTYEGRKLDAQLNEAADIYINNGEAVRFSRTGLVISQLYYWNPDDFNGTDVGILEHLALYAREPLKEKLRLYRSNLAYSYDWSLNGE